MAMHFWAVTHANSKDGSPPQHAEPLGYVAGFLTWMLAGSVFVAVKLVSDEMPPWTMVCFRALISALVLLPFVAHHFPEMSAFLHKRWKEAFFIGAIGLGLTQGLVFTSLHHTSAVNAGIVFATAPMITMVLASFLLQEPMNRWQALGSLVAFCGIVVVAVKGSLSALMSLQIGFGDLVALCGACLFAGYTVLLKRAKFELEPIPLTTILLFSGSLAAVPFALYEFVDGQHSNLKRNGYLALLYCSVFGGAFMYLLYNTSVRLLGATRAGTLVYTQMLFVALFAWLILGEPIEPYHFAGGLLIIVGVLLVTLLRPKTGPSNAS